MNEIYLKYSESETGGEPVSDEKWCNYSDVHKTFEPISLHLNKLNWQETITVPFAPIWGDEVYLIVVRYQDGDSFGCSYGNWNCLGVTLDKSLAETIAKCIKDRSEDSTVLEEFKLLLTEYGRYPSWTGYFNRLEDVEIHKMILEV